MPVRTVIGGDARVRAISAASIIAKVHRDRLLHRPARGASGVRLRRPQGLLDARAPGGAARAWRLQAPPAQLRAGARGHGPAVLKARRRWPATSSPTSPRATTPCSFACASWRAHPGEYRKVGQLLLEGEHLCQAWATRGGAPALQALITETRMAARAPTCALAEAAAATVVVADAAMAELSALDTPAPIAFVVPLAAAAGDPRRRAQRRPRPGPGRRQRRLDPAQRRGLRLRPGDRSRGHGVALVAQGAARRHGRAFRAGADREPPGRGARCADVAADRHQLARRGKHRRRRARRAVRLGVRQRRARARAPRCRGVAPGSCAFPSPAARSRSTSALRPRSASTNRRAAGTVGRRRSTRACRSGAPPGSSPPHRRPSRSGTRARRGTRSGCPPC